VLKLLRWLAVWVAWWSESALVCAQDHCTDVVTQVVAVAGHGASTDVADDGAVVAGEHGCAVTVAGGVDESPVEQRVAGAAEPDEVVHGGRSTVEPGHEVVDFEVAVVAARGCAAVLLGGEHG
jgi:hypothetical protein